MRPDARLFRLLLRLYPAHFRDEYGAEMTEFFLHRLDRARARRARPALAVAHLWARTVVDVVRTAAAEHGSALRQDRPTTEDTPMSSFLQDLRYAARRLELPFAFVSRGYFEAMGIDRLAGRTFEAYDRPDSPPVIVVNETAARMFFGGDALGGRIRSQGAEGAWREVVGVVSDVTVNGLQEAPTPMIYYSAEQAGIGTFTLVARTAGDPATILGALRSAFREVRPSLPVTRLLTLDAHLGQSLAGLRAAVAFMGAFSLLALMLASLGVYAVVSFTVGRRTQELGIRVALGAPRARIVGMIVGESLIVVVLGFAVGFGLSVLATRGLAAMLFGVGALDEVTFAGAAALLLLAAGTAAFLPARRAAGANPVEVLRSQ
ncbi:MAG TPA: FtsX-like permease family protein [Gemmatimonadaceae bacterium]|nr:FtsX-like permease family protein [Gemmatimonadaceae bacterium]